MYVQLRNDLIKSRGNKTHFPFVLSTFYTFALNDPDNPIPRINSRHVDRAVAAGATIGNLSFFPCAVHQLTFDQVAALIIRLLFRFHFTPDSPRMLKHS